MPEVKWIKISTKFPENRKIKMLKSLPNGDSLCLIWIEMLCIAGDTNDNGFLYFTREVPYTPESLAIQLNRPKEIVSQALEMFKKFDMINGYKGNTCIKNWEKYQSLDKLEKIKELTKQRVANHRKKLKKAAENNNVTQCNVTSNASVTLCNATDIDIDKDIDIYNKYSSIPEEFDGLWRLYPRKEGKKDAFKHYKKAREKGISFEEVMKGIERYNEHIKLTGIEHSFIKHGSSWFCQEGWNDEYNNETSKSKQKKEEQLPPWYDEYKKNSGKNEEDTITEKEKEELKKLTSRMFG